MTEKMQKNIGKRIQYLDFLRVISMIAVITIHVSANNWYGYVETNRWIILTIYDVLARFSVPVFFMISGAVFLQDTKELDIRKLYRKNIFKMLLVLVFWSSLYYLYSLDFKFGRNELLAGIKYFLYGNTESHLWFLYVIIGLYILLPVTKAIVGSGTRAVEYFLILHFVTVTLRYTLAAYPSTLSNMLTINISKMGLNLVEYLGYFLLGYYLHTYGFSRKINRAIYILGILGAGASVGLTVFISRKMNSPTEGFMHYLTLPIFLFSVAVFVGAKEFYGERDRRWVRLLADSSLGVYIVHMFAVRFLWKIGFTTFSFQALFSVPVIVCLVLLVSEVFVQVIHRIPKIGNWII